MTGSTDSPSPPSRDTFGLRVYCVGFSAFFVFSALFNYLPFYLTGEPFRASTNLITLVYLSYVIGVVIAPLSGRISNRYGNGVTMAAGALVFAGSLGATHIPELWAVCLGLCGVCLGFFSVHSAAVGSMNRRLRSNRGLANSLYVLLYYLGGRRGSPFAVTRTRHSAGTASPASA